jgi:hypothetical protein
MQDMARLLSSKLPWLLVSGGVLCAGQSERVVAMQWADYYSAVYRVPPELVHAIIDVLTQNPKTRQRES